ncbi:MAG: YlxR family protein [Acidimicrobiales bacterium]
MAGVSVKGDPGPVRTCVGCRRRAPAGQLTRLVADEEGRLVEGLPGHARGAWLCRGSPACFEAALRHRAFASALRRSVDVGGQLGPGRPGEAP